MVEMHCIVCENELVMFDHLHPQAALHFKTYGHYGSTFFDPMDGSTMNIAVCDSCLEKKKEFCYGD